MCVRMKKEASLDWLRYQNDWNREYSVPTYWYKYVIQKTSERLKGHQSPMTTTFQPFRSANPLSVQFPATPDFYFLRLFLSYRWPMLRALVIRGLGSFNSAAVLEISPARAMER